MNFDLLKRDRFEPRLHPTNDVLHATIGPVLTSAERSIVEIDVGNLTVCVAPVVVATMLAITDARVMQSIEAEGIDLVLLNDLRRYSATSLSTESAASIACCHRRHETDRRNSSR